ncbi:MAG TPA: TIGR02444 family protein [Parvibaculum sp.]
MAIDPGETGDESGGGAEAFWAFSTALYARPGVEPALLALQDADGLEVNLVLFCLFAGSRGQSLDGPSIAAMQGVGDIWGREVVGPLRTVRRQLKALGSENGTAASLRDEVMQAELAAEKAMQTALSDLLAGEGDGGRSVAEANLAVWVMAEELTMTEANTDAFRTVLDAAFPA